MHSSRRVVAKSFALKYIHCFSFAVAVYLFAGVSVLAQAGDPSASPALPTQFRVGERLSYAISFEQFTSAGYAEIHVVSRGRLGDRDVVELKSKVKTTEIVSAAFYMLDEARTVFASSDTGYPVHVTRVTHSGIEPREAVTSYLQSPATGFDLLTLIYRARLSGGTGAFTLLEDGRPYSANMQIIGSERVKTDAGEFDATVSTLQSDYFAELGVKDVRIWFSADEQRLPLLARFSTPKGVFSATLSSIQVAQIPTQVDIDPVPVPTPAVTPTPKPIPTPTPYIGNQPLSPYLTFQLGEALRYRVTAMGQPAGEVLLEAKERNLFNGQDSLLLSATVTAAEGPQRLFSPNDFSRAQVSPDTLEPRYVETRFGGEFSSLNQTATFDQGSAVIISGTERIDAPVGTHSLLSLLYAVRSFNLKPSRDLNNPVNDTRVAVFFNGKAHIFSLRPAEAAVLDLNGVKVPAQQITVTTGDPAFDILGIRIWLANDASRVPLRIAAGRFQADLISRNGIPIQ